MNIHTGTIHRCRLEVCLFIFFLNPPFFFLNLPTHPITSLPFHTLAVRVWVWWLLSVALPLSLHNVVYDDHMVKDQIAPGTCWHCLSSLLTPVCSKRVLVRAAALVPCTHPTVLRFSLVGSQGLSISSRPAQRLGAWLAGHRSMEPQLSQLLLRG